MNDRGPFIQTYSGIRFYSFDPRPEEILIEDIAHHLSQINRYTGASRYPYSVAQHSCYVYDYCRPEYRLWGLLHDASEAYINDIAGPIKQTGMFDDYRDLEYSIMWVVCRKFGLETKEPSNVKYVDRMVLGTEHRYLMKDNFDMEYYPDLVIVPWTAKRAKREFMRRFDDCCNL